MEGIDKEMYKSLADGLAQSVDDMNNNKGLVDFFRGIEYNINEKSYDEFVNHREDIVITSTSKNGRKTEYGSPMVAKIYVNESRDGLEGCVYSGASEGERVKVCIHSFSHKYGVTTGNLLS